MANAETEKNEQLAKLQAELDAAIAERDALKTSEAPASAPAGPSPREQELDEQLQALQSEKAALEAQIAELQATTAAAAASSVPDVELAAKLVRHLEQESRVGLLITVYRHMWSRSGMPCCQRSLPGVPLRQTQRAPAAMTMQRRKS